MQGEVFPDAEMLFLVKLSDDIRRRKLIRSTWRLSLQQNILVGAAMAEDESSEPIQGIGLIGSRVPAAGTLLGSRPIIKDQVQHFQLAVLHQRHVMETFPGSLALQVEASILSISFDTVQLVELGNSFLRDLRNQVTKFADPVLRSGCVANQWKRNDLSHII